MINGFQLGSSMGSMGSTGSRDSSESGSGDSSPGAIFDSGSSSSSSSENDEQTPLQFGVHRPNSLSPCFGAWSTNYHIPRGASSFSNVGVPALYEQILDLRIRANQEQDEMHCSNSSELAKEIAVSNAAIPKTTPASLDTIKQTVDGIVMSIDEPAIWGEFQKAGTEMIINRNGRRMFPPIELFVSGLDSTALYNVYLKISPADAMRYKYVNNSWVSIGKSIDNNINSPFKYTNGSNLGSFLERTKISFATLKLSNNRERLNDCAVLQSMHRYQPVLEIEKLTQNGDTLMSRFIFPEVSFMAVTAYQNQNVKNLKIQYNPFARAFRSSASQSQCEVELACNENGVSQPVYSMTGKGIEMLSYDPVRVPVGNTRYPFPVQHPSEWKGMHGHVLSTAIPPSIHNKPSAHDMSLRSFLLLDMAKRMKKKHMKYVSSFASSGRSQIYNRPHSMESRNHLRAQKYIRARKGGSSNSSLGKYGASAAVNMHSMNEGFQLRSNTEPTMTSPTMTSPKDQLYGVREQPQPQQQQKQEHKKTSGSKLWKPWESCDSSSNSSSSIINEKEKVEHPRAQANIQVFDHNDSKTLDECRWPATSQSISLPQSDKLHTITRPSSENLQAVGSSSYENLPAVSLPSPEDLQAMSRPSPKKLHTISRLPPVRYHMMSKLPPKKFHMISRPSALQYHTIPKPPPEEHRAMNMLRSKEFCTINMLPMENFHTISRPLPSHTISRQSIVANEEKQKESMEIQEFEGNDEENIEMSEEINEVLDKDTSKIDVNTYQKRNIIPMMDDAFDQSVNDNEVKEINNKTLQIKTHVQTYDKERPHTIRAQKSSIMGNKPLVNIKYKQRADIDEEKEEDTIATSEDIIKNVMNSNMTIWNPLNN
ncbi:unnamed protein product [Owenia fusiformis]|uniref:T-box domain-containing protein n=1 Tax=Owenia fusiformis TaxID=6347 RepID=A0A8S4NQB5_OWEFU|nr:unnamed protein product [Owenia fusiformis]